MMNFKTFRMLAEEFDRHPNTQFGTNPGGRYTHNVTGKDYYIKFPRNPEQAKVEVAAAKIYHVLGIPTMSPSGKDISGRIGVVTPWREDIKNYPEHELKHRTETDNDFANKMVHLHVASALIRNHDAIGLWDSPNLMKDEQGNHISIDQGGSFHFRAQGEPKDFGHDAKEDMESLRVDRRPSGQIFNRAYINTTPEQHKAAIENLRNLTDQHIDAIISHVNLKPEVAETLKRRRDSLLEIASEKAKEQKT